jgi:DNA modification methylase
VYTYIQKTKQNDHHNYYLTEHFLKEGKPTTRTLASYGHESPVFYKPEVLSGSCEDYLEKMPACSVDLIIDDPPYGLTQLKWDKAPDWHKLAGLYHKVLKNNGLVYVFGRQPSLISIYNSFSELFDFRFELIWNKKTVSWSSNHKPLPVHENIFVFCKKGTPVSETKFYINKYIMGNGKPYSTNRTGNKKSPTHGKYTEDYKIKNKTTRYPKSVLEYPIIWSSPEYSGFPTQKPLEFIKWMILASSKTGDVVLDPHVGSGTTLLAALWLCRRSIGIEIDKDTHKLASDRIEELMYKIPKNHIQQEKL